MPAAALAARLLPQPWTPSNTMPRGGSKCSAGPSWKKLRRTSIRLAQAPHAADFRKLGRFVFEGERRIAAEEFVFRAHDLGQLRLRDGAVIVYRFDGETPGVGGGKAGQVADKQIEIGRASCRERV